MSREVLREIIEALDKGQQAALAVLTNISGSAPGRVGAMLGVFENGRFIGTIGGGLMEFAVKEQALAVMAGGNNRHFSYDLSENGEFGMSCGGKAEGFITVFKPNDQLVIFGAGHVSQKVAAISQNLSFDVYIVDDREEYQTLPDFAEVKSYLAAPLDEAVQKINFTANTYVVIATRGHETDLQVLKKIIKLNVAYIGMIGSRNKIAGFRTALLQEGVSETDFGKLFAPIGLKIDDGSPPEIALGILSEILAVKNKRIDKKQDRAYL